MRRLSLILLIATLLLTLSPALAAAYPGDLPRPSAPAAIEVVGKVEAVVGCGGPFFMDIRYLAIETKDNTLVTVPVRNGPRIDQLLTVAPGDLVLVYVRPPVDGQVPVVYSKSDITVISGQTGETPLPYTPDVVGSLLGLVVVASFVWCLSGLVKWDESRETHPGVA
jgi:hypothetical protein